MITNQHLFDARVWIKIYYMYNVRSFSMPEELFAISIFQKENSNAALK